MFHATACDVAPLAYAQRGTLTGPDTSTLMFYASPAWRGAECILALP